MLTRRNLLLGVATGAVVALNRFDAKVWARDAEPNLFMGNPNGVVSAVYTSGIGSTQISNAGTPLAASIFVTGISVSPVTYDGVTVNRLSVTTTESLPPGGFCIIQGVRGFVPEHNVAINGNFKPFTVIDATHIDMWYGTPDKTGHETAYIYGSGYSGGGTLALNKWFTDVALTGGSGTGAKADIWVETGRGVVKAVIKEAGKNYQVGDVLSASSSDIYGTVGFNLTVKSLGILDNRALDAKIYTPALIHVSAAGISAEGTCAPYPIIRPYQDLHFEWDFGEPGGNCVVANPVTNQPQEMNNVQVGPEAFYRYTTPGFKKITLTVRWWDGTGYRSATQFLSKSIAAWVPTHTKYFDLTAPSKGADGSMAHPFNDLKNMRNWLESGFTQIYIARGSLWTDTNLVIAAQGTGGPCRINAYGSGPNPQIRVVSKNIISCIYMLASYNDLYIQNLDLVVDSSNNTSNGFYASTSNVWVYGTPNKLVSNIVFEGCNLETSLPYPDEACADFAVVSYYLLNCTMSGPSTAAAGGASRWYGIIGCKFTGTGGGRVYDHHIYAINCNNMLVAYCSFPLAATLNLCLKQSWNERWSDGSRKIISRYTNTRNNHFRGSRAAVAPSWSNVGSMGSFASVVIEQNAFSHLNILSSGAISVEYCLETTIRYNYVWNIGSSYFIGSPNLNFKDVYAGCYYGNKIFVPSTQRGGAMIFWNPTYLYGGKNQVTDNIIVDMRSAASIFNVVAKSWILSGSLAARNRYWAPNSGWGAPTNPTAFIDGFFTRESFSAWKTIPIDQTSIIKNPKWIDPGNGNFNPQ